MLRPVWLLTARAPVPVAEAICLPGKPAYYAGPALRAAALEGAAPLSAAWRDDRPRLMWPVTACALVPIAAAIWVSGRPA